MSHPTLLALAAAVAPAAAQTSAPDTARQESRRPAYNYLDRSEEDWTPLRDPSLRNDPWDLLKLVPLRRDGRWYLTVGGEVRAFYEFYRNYNWGAGPQDDNGFFLQRLIGSADAHFGRRARLFLELKSGLEFGRIGGPRPVRDEDRLDLGQLFVELHAHSPANRPVFTVQLGRQQLQYGEGGLLDVRDLNVRRSFDGLKAVVRPAGWRIDLFAMRPAQSKPGVFDDSPDRSQTLWGVYAVTARQSPRFFRQFDFYYLGLNRKGARFDQGTGRDERHTVGILVHGQSGRFSIFSEGIIQGGRFGGGRLLAWKYAQSVSRSFPGARLRPTVSLLGAVSSGDGNLADSNLRTFHPLFPKGVYYGFIDGHGSLNAVVVHPRLSVRLSERVSLTSNTHLFWRQRSTDGLYSQAGVLLRSGQGSRAHHVGTLHDVALAWAVDGHAAVHFLAAYYDVGRFLRATQPPGRNVTYLGIRTNYIF